MIDSCGTVHYKADSFEYRLLRAYALLNVTNFFSFVGASDVISSGLLIR